MAHFRNRVIQIDDELAAREIVTKLDYSELDPYRDKCEVNVKKIAEALLLTANHMQN
jgi:hypothetical protein